MAHSLRRHQKTCVTFSARDEDLMLKERRLSVNYRRMWNVHLFNVFTEHVPVHMQDRNIKGHHFHLEGLGAPQLFREFINLYRWYFFNFRGFKFKMSSPSRSSQSRNYTSPFQGVVLLSLFVAGLQNSRLNRVECTFSTIPTCVLLPCGVSYLTVYLRIYRCTSGTSPDCCSSLHFPYGFWFFSHYRLSFSWFVAW